MLVSILCIRVFAQEDLGLGRESQEADETLSALKSTSVQHTHDTVQSPPLANDDKPAAQFVSEHLASSTAPYQHALRLPSVPVEPFLGIEYCVWLCSSWTGLWMARIFAVSSILSYSC